MGGKAQEASALQKELQAAKEYAEGGRKSSPRESTASAGQYQVVDAENGCKKPLYRLNSLYLRV